jgi:hypothetical protein
MSIEKPYDIQENSASMWAPDPLPRGTEFRIDLSRKKILRGYLTTAGR